MIKKLLTAIVIALPTTVMAEEGDNCITMRGDTTVKVCSFTLENSPACHPLEDYPAGPQDLANSYGGQVRSYKYAPDAGGFLLTIIRPMGDGTMGAITFFHEGSPNGGVEPGAEACIVAIGSQVSGEPV